MDVQGPEAQATTEHYIDRDQEPVSRTVLKLRNYLALPTCVNSMVYIVKYLRKPTQDSLTPGFTKLA